MQQHHPLENPSLAPYGFVFPDARKRLEYMPRNPDHWVNEEKLIARMWDRANRMNAPQPRPVETIVHEVLPSFAAANRPLRGDFVFCGRPYLTRDILLLSRTMQWFGTSVGRDFLESDISKLGIPGFHPEREFRIKLARRMERVDSVAHLAHICTSECETVHDWRGGCYWDPRAVSARDRAVVDGLMYWLGQPHGRAFIAAFQRRKHTAWDAAHERQRVAWGIQRSS